MDELLSEKEQIEAIRSWWHENGRYVLSGIVIGVGLLFGWNYWNDHEREAEQGASALYESLVAEVADADVPAAEEIAERMQSEYDGTVYALQTRLAMSRLYMDVGRDEDAAGQLRPLVDEDSEPEISLLARLRLGKILLYQDKPQEVVDLLEGHRETAFGARYNETLGDAYVALGRVEDAAAAYSAALADDPNTPTVDRTLIQMKIYDLPEVPASAALEADTVANEGVAGSEVVPADVQAGSGAAAGAAGKASTDAAQEDDDGDRE